MSFLNQILAQLGGGGHSTSPASAIGTTEAIQQPLRSASISNVPIGANRATNAGQKRKAEEELQRIMAKTPKRNESTKRPSASTDSKAIATPPSDSIPKLRTLSSSTPNPPIPPTSNTGTSIPVKKSQEPPATNTPKAPPKKGSYAEILARANAGQAAAAKIGIIKHKPVEGGLRKKDRLNQRRECKDIPKQLVKNGTRDGKNERLPLPGKGGDREKPAKNKTGESTYKGTARAKPAMPAYKGTARPNNPSPTKLSRRGEPLDRNRSRSTSLNPRPSRYHYASEEDDAEEEDYETDASSDMEANPFELEEEEQLSMRTAKKEDEEALKEEMRLKRQKDEKKKKLAALAAKRR
ncbi:hypothetical protein FGG08_000849 [Glutinoglossum americanum]|uniref:SPT2 chromatin protein n=1 Tax=Glutinoglossum americanum TaxID=1670608 RepID=A0A9P8IHP1_9PEZI|nr:hypothetical protein FGG08_000849 [Glutinoglossum americanum]